jgi:hypothetical protein
MLLLVLPLHPSHHHHQKSNPLFKETIQPKISEVLPVFVKLEKRNNQALKKQELPNIITIQVATLLIQVIGLKSAGNQKGQKQLL